MLVLDSITLRRILPRLSIVLATLLWSSAAQAAGDLQSSSITTSAPQAELSLKTGNGYSVSVEGSGRRVALTVNRGLAFTTYVTPGRASPDGVRARFGHFGRVSVRFKPSGKVRRKKPPKRCKGKAAIVRPGVFVGTIRFEGEDGYIEIDAHRAKGSTSTRPRWRCRPLRAAARLSALRDGHGPDTAVLEASTLDERVFFEAAGFRDPKGPDLIFFLAGSAERRGSVRIARIVLAISRKARTFVFDRPPRSATVTPPKPFHGAATFERGPGGTPLWSGSLSVSLLGEPSLPLTGASFTAQLHRAL
jgi:hypothetical protein